MATHTTSRTLCSQTLTRSEAHPKQEGQQDEVFLFLGTSGVRITEPYWGRWWAASRPRTFDEQHAGYC